MHEYAASAFAAHMLSWPAFRTGRGPDLVVGGSAVLGVDTLVFRDDTNTIVTFQGSADTMVLRIERQGRVLVDRRYDDFGEVRDDVDEHLRV